MKKCPVPPLCRHCSLRPPCRPRALCWGCYNDVEIRRLHSPLYLLPHRKREVKPDDLLPDTAAEAASLPTDAAPGSPRKIAVLRSRANLGLPLFVRGDADMSAAVAARVASRDGGCEDDEEEEAA